MRTARAEIALPTPQTRADGLNTLAEVTERLLSQVNYVRHIVVSCGGLVRKDGTVEKSLYTPFSGVNLASFFQDQFKIGALVRNDAHLQFLGLPVGRGTFVLLTWGTGIGGAFGHNGWPAEGHSNFAGEFGHSLKGSSTKCCACGSRGCLDLTASGRALDANLGQNWYDRLTDMNVAERLKQVGCELASVQTLLGRLFDPRCLCLTGRIFGIAQVRMALNNRPAGDWPRYRSIFCLDSWALIRRGAIRLVDSAEGIL